jgi:hypothetical protein
MRLVWLGLIHDNLPIPFLSFPLFTFSLSFYLSFILDFVLYIILKLQYYRYPKINRLKNEVQN